MILFSDSELQRMICITATKLMEWNCNKKNCALIDVPNTHI
jgi:hypothetical protein